VNYARRQQYRRLSRAGIGVTSLISSHTGSNWPALSPPNALADRVATATTPRFALNTGPGSMPAPARIPELALDP
jgi:hypothetical protein